MTAELVLDTLLETSVRATVVAAMTGLALAVFRVKTPSVRHAAWTAALVVMLLLPVASRYLPTVPLPAWVPQMPVGAAAIVSPTAVQTIVETSDVTSNAVPMRTLESSNTPAAIVPAASGTTALPTRPLQTPWTWRQWIAVVWFGVAVFFVVRELAGAWMARRLARSGVPVEGDASTFASARIVTPVVVGMLSPRVMVPPSWPKWGAGVREMVLVHERAHVTRRDPLVAGLARLNRAVLWFHPLAWWLERHLSRTAEQACDELVVRAVPDQRLYAALLVEMAKRLHHHKSRVAWQGIGVVDGRFEDRVDRVLSGITPPLSRSRMAALGVVSTFLISLAVACGTQAAPLAEDPDLAKKIAASRASFANYEAAIRMDLEQATALEKVLANNPDDLDATAKLLTFYMSKGSQLLGWSQMVAARRPLLLRMIERQPESFLVRWPLSRRLDPEGYEQARALWLAHVERPDASPELLAHAATFFERVEKPLAEQLLLRGPSRPFWSRRLGTLYAMAIAGSHDQTVFDDVTTVDAAQLHSSFAKHARQKLEQSSDAELLLGAGNFLIAHAAQAKLDFDPTALGREFVSRASRLDPASVEAKRILGGPDHNLQYEQMLQRFGGAAHALDDAKFEQLSEATKLEFAPDFLWSPYGEAMAAYRRADKQAIEAAFTRLKSRADVFQRLADNTARSSVPPALQFDLHMAFGTWAMHQGNRREAVRRLSLASSTVAAWPTERIGIGIAAEKLANDLLDAGERESVAGFYDAIAPQFANELKTTYAEAAAAIRGGKMPASYQLMVAARSGTGNFYVR